MIRGLRSASLMALAVVVVAVVAAVVAVFAGRQLDGVRAEREAASAAADAVTVVSEALRTALSQAEEATSAERSASAAVTQGVPAATLVLARDSGLPVLDDIAGGMVVVGRYAGSGPPRTAQERRDRLSGFVTVPLDLATTLKPLIPEDGGIAVSGPDREVASNPPGGPRSAASFTTSLGADLASGWTITVWTGPTGTPLGSWLVAMLLVSAGLAVAGWLLVRQKESRRQIDELRELQQTSATVAELATLAQTSLDLGEVIPAVTTALSAALGLRGLSLTAPTPQGDRPIFVLGVTPGSAAPSRGREELPVGQSLAIVLSRGGRIVATLHVTAGRFLSRSDVRTLFAASEVLTSALTNADVFRQQLDLISRMRTVDELKTVFLATASHELRTPVVTMAGYANLLHDNWDQLTPADARAYAAHVDSIAKRLSTLVEDILDFSRLQSGNGLAAGAVLLDLADVVGQVLDEQTDLVADHHLIYQPGTGLQVSGSRQAIERVLTNLVGNAVKYSDPGSTIRVSTREAEGCAELVVADEGPGISADQREQVFSPFYRGSGDEVVRTRGAGLGLAIVAEFAAAMGGHVRLDEAETGGASFSVAYPIVTTDAVVDPEPGVSHVHT